LQHLASEHNSVSNDNNIPISSLVNSIQTQEQLEHNSEPKDNNKPIVDISTQDCNFDSDGSTSTNSIPAVGKMLVDDEQDAGEVKAGAVVLKIMRDDGKQNMIRDDYPGAAKHKADRSASAQLADVRNDVQNWLNNRQGKLLGLLEETYDNIRVGSMYDSDEILTNKYSTHHITGKARLNIVCALDPKIEDPCVYTGVAKFRLLTLRKCGWLDCSVINQVIILLKTSGEFNCKPNIALHGSYWLKHPKLITVDVGRFHVIICNVNGNHWVTIEVDDMADPRPQQLLCRVFGLFGNYVLESVIDECEHSLKPRFITQLLWQSATSDFESNQNGYDCWIICLRRAQVHLKVGEGSVDNATFQALGSFRISRIVYMDLILKHSKISKNNIPDTLSKFSVGQGTKEEPLVLDTLKQSQSIAKSKVEPEELRAGDVIIYWRPIGIVGIEANRAISQILNIKPTIRKANGVIVKRKFPLTLYTYDGPSLDLETRVWRATLKYVDNKCVGFTTNPRGCLIKNFKLIESEIGNPTIGEVILFDLLRKRQQELKQKKAKRRTRTETTTAKR
jgi:hypothetical protein